MAEERPSGFQRGGGRSHYQFKSWVWDNNGKRTTALPVHSKFAASADLVNTCYLNRAKNTETLYAIGFDFDAHRANPAFLTKTGKIKWNKIKRLLLKEYPELYAHIFAVVKSTGGNGLALYLAISPLELVPSTLRAQLAAEARAMGFQQLRITGTRLSGASPGKSVDIIMDLTK